MNAVVPNSASSIINPHPHLPSGRPIRFASTKHLSRDEWLQLRKQGIGSSDAAAAVGLNPYQSMLELWLIKTGRDQDLPKPDFEDDSSPLYWGSILEPIVAQHYSQRTGHKVRRVNAILQHPDPQLPWMLANLDYRVSGCSEVSLLECKTAGEYGARLWRNGVPEYVQLQVQHQLAVTGEQAADVCVLICGQQIQIHRIERDDELIARLIELEQQFWHYVETDTPPPADGSASAQAALRALYPQDAGTVLDLSHDPDLNQTFDQYLDLRQQLEQAEQQEEHLKQQLQQRMGDASQAVFAKGSVSWKRSKDSAALAVYMRLHYPHLDIRYFFTDTGKELPEVYDFLAKLEGFIGKPIERINGDRDFDFWLKQYNNFLPSAQTRWCTRQLKLDPFKKWIKPWLDQGDKVYSYVAIRADEEHRTGLISQHENLEVVLPFRQNGVDKPAVFEILEASGLGLPAYYDWRSRSGCTFCFFQQKIEWVRLRERHPEAFEDAKTYEKTALNSGSPFTWTQGEPLTDLEKPERITAIKADFEKRKARLERQRRPNPLREGLIDMIDIDDLYLEDEGAGACLVCHK